MTFKSNKQRKAVMAKHSLKSRTRKVSLRKSAGKSNTLASGIAKNQSFEGNAKYIFKKSI